MVLNFKALTLYKHKNAVSIADVRSRNRSHTEKEESVGWPIIFGF